MGMNSLPDELLCQILIKLPAKSLVKIRCVCKFWHSLIISSDFISLHLNHTHDFGKPTVLFRRMILKKLKEIYTFHDDDCEFHAFETLDFPFKSKTGCFIILGCVDGLVCLWDYKSEIVMLWNPCIRKCYTLPEIIEWYSFRVFGFGYDALADDYKVVVRASYGDSDLDDEYDGLGSVFSLREGCWRKIDFVPNWNSWSRPRAVGGVIHRITELDDQGIKIVSFDLSSDLCSEIACPDEVKNNVPPCCTDLSIFRDSLAIIHPVNQKICNVWVLREGGAVKSWSKLFSLDLEETIWEQSVAGFSKNGLALLVGRGSSVVKPVMDSPIIVNLQPSEPEFHWHVESYRESLVLLEEGADVTLPAHNDSDEEEVGAEEAATIIID